MIYFKVFIVKIIFNILILFKKQFETHFFENELTLSV